MLGLSGNFLLKLKPSTCHQVSLLCEVSKYMSKFEICTKEILSVVADTVVLSGPRRAL